MMKKTLLQISIILLSHFIYAQSIYMGKDKGSLITFYSDAPLEKIEAKNTSVTPVFNLSTGDFQVRVHMQAFQFKNDLMREHFNENYVESEKYPYCVFKGKADVSDFEEGKEYDVNMTGKMEMHGVTNNVSVKGKVKKQNNELILSAEFFIKPADYKIKIPTMLTKKIAEEVKVNFKSVLIPYTKK